MSDNFERTRERAKRTFANILSNGYGYTFMWVSMVFVAATYLYLPSPISGIVGFGIILVFLTYNYWAPERYIIDAAKTGNIEAIKKYLQKGGNINFKSIEGHTALLVASGYASNEVVSFLIDNGADVNAVLDNLESPLYWAVASKDITKVEILINRGAELDAKEDMGQTPLHLAVSRNLVDIANLLINRGADVNTRADDGKTLLEIALEKNNPEMIELIRNYS